MTEAAPSNGKLTTPVFRLSFPSLFEPKAGPGAGAKEKYRLVMLFDKKEDLRALKKLAFDAIVSKWGSDKAKWPANLRTINLTTFLTVSGKDGWPFRDGDAQNYDGYPGMVSVPASSEVRPIVVDQKLKPVLDKSDVYPGCYCRASINAFAWDNSGNRGVSFGLLGVQKVKDGEPFTSRCDPDTDFTPLDDFSDDPGAYSEVADF